MVIAPIDIGIGTKGALQNNFMGEIAIPCSLRHPEG
jgi:hypothetical protein